MRFPLYCQSSVRRLLPASDNCRARANQIVERISDNGTVLGSSRKLGGAAEHLIDGSEKRICQLEFSCYWKSQYLTSWHSEWLPIPRGLINISISTLLYPHNPFQFSWLKEFSDWFEMEI